MGAIAGVMAAALLAIGAPMQATGETIPAPATQLSADGTTATDGARTLTVSRASGLNPDGQTVTVTGNGYDDFKGVYVAFCLIPPTNQPPSPCGGGIDQSGASGASSWISSNPPPYAAGLTTAYGPGGTFTISVNVVAAINANVDCRRVRCAIVTRNDHTRSTDRSQDIFVPVTFADPAAAATPTTAPPPAVTTPPTDAPATGTPTTVAPVDPAPTTVVPAGTPTTTRAPVASTTAVEVDGVAASTNDGDSDSSAAPWIVGAVVVIVLGAAAWFGRRFVKPAAS